MGLFRPAVAHRSSFADRFVIPTIAQTLSKSLKDFDPTVYDLIRQEKNRQFASLDLIASENFTPRYCSEALASCLSTKYSEGMPGNRYYAGNGVIDKIERLCADRALRAFNLDATTWNVNVQALSGSPANFAVFTALLEPGDTILALDLPHGGHLSHGFKTPSAKVTATSKYFNTVSYHLNAETELIDYDEMRLLARKHRPRMIIAGASAYPRLIEYNRFREVCDEVGAYLLVDMAHIAGLVSAEVIPTPFPYADVVTTTTHKTLRGPRGALVFAKRDLMPKINKGIFPACQGGPHNHTIAAVATAMLACLQQEFKRYQRQVWFNAKAMETAFKSRGLRLISGGTDNHLILADLSNIKGVDGKFAEMLLDSVGIVTNKNTVLSDRNPMKPRGLRFGSPALTSRGMEERQFTVIANLIMDVLLESSAIVTRPNHAAVKETTKLVKTIRATPLVREVAEKVHKLATAFPVPQSVLWPNEELLK